MNKFNETELLEEVQDYIDDTYKSHYADNKYQATDIIIDAGLGKGFCMGNIIKYIKRYGRKQGYNRKDILKLTHYAIIMLHVHDKENN